VASLCDLNVLIIQVHALEEVARDLDLLDLLLERPQALLIDSTLHFFYAHDRAFMTQGALVDAKEILLLERGLATENASLAKGHLLGGD